MGQGRVVWLGLWMKHFGDGEAGSGRMAGKARLIQPWGGMALQGSWGQPARHPSPSPALPRPPGTAGQAWRGLTTACCSCSPVFGLGFEAERAEEGVPSTPQWLWGSSFFGARQLYSGHVGARGNAWPRVQHRLGEAGRLPCISLCQPSSPPRPHPPLSTLHGFRLWVPQEALTCRVFNHMTRTAEGPQGTCAEGGHQVTCLV